MLCRSLTARAGPLRRLRRHLPRGAGEVAGSFGWREFGAGVVLGWVMGVYLGGWPALSDQGGDTVSLRQGETQDGLPLRGFRLSWHMKTGPWRALAWAGKPRAPSVGFAATSPAARGRSGEVGVG